METRNIYQTITECLHYDPDTGLLIWKKAPNRKPFLLGKPAGVLCPDGYIRIKIAGKMIIAQRVIWFMQTGGWPAQKVDHKDRVRNNNKWENLRLANDLQNAKNRTGSGVVGVTRYTRGGWQVHLRGKWIGRFDHFCKAFKARMNAETKHATSP